MYGKRQEIGRRKLQNYGFKVPRLTFLCLFYMALNGWDMKDANMWEIKMHIKFLRFGFKERGGLKKK